MGEAMVTGRMAPGKKRRGALVLQREGINASQAINRMYDRIIEDGNAEFLTDRCVADDESAWVRAAEFVDSICTKRSIVWTGDLAGSTDAADSPAVDARTSEAASSDVADAASLTTDAATRQVPTATSQAGR